MAAEMWNRPGKGGQGYEGQPYAISTSRSWQDHNLPQRGEGWGRGYGSDQYVYHAKPCSKQFLGGTFEVESRDELEKVLSVTGAQPSRMASKEMVDAPGGGFIVTVQDALDSPLNFAWGQSLHKPRKKRFQRFEPGPADVYKLGHFGLNVPDFPGALDWYTRDFNFVPDYILYVPTGEIENTYIAAHSRCTTLIRRHWGTSGSPIRSTICLRHRQNPGLTYLFTGGVVHGIMVENYAHSDLVNNSTPMGYKPAGHEGLAGMGTRCAN
ncbi:hypothetical protein GE09DRAFT_1174441 [Coniochaeta sp. 2T2.1]|nr:hypothetical protein GE09DRAFT_1174441 [Coniochaeta sp. 2T2.1]